MPALNKVYDRLLIIRPSIIGPGLEGQVMGKHILTPTRLIRELTMVIFPGHNELNFLAERHLAVILADGENKFIEAVSKRAPLGIAIPMMVSVSPRLFGYWGIKVSGDYVPSAQDIPKAYEIISR